MLDRKIVMAVLENSSGADFCEIFVEDKEELSVKGADGIAKARLCGAGIHLISGASSVYVYTNDLSEASLMRSSQTANELLGISKKQPKPVEFVTGTTASPCPVEIYPAAAALRDKIKLISEAEKAARAAGEYLVNLSLAYFDTDQRVLIAASDGTWAEDRRVTSRLRVYPTLAVAGGDAAGHFAEYSRAKGFEAFRNGQYLDFIQHEIKSQQEVLFADEAPSGYIPVILEGGGCAGTFFHESCGHLLETTRLSESPFYNRLGEKIASERVTLVDDGTIAGMYGSSAFDDEGMPRRKNILIENGVLKSHLTDRLGAIRYGLPRSASGRRQGYAYAPGARMSNTYLAAGPDDNDEIIRSVPEGLLVTEIGGGTGGAEFTLMANKAYWIKNGKIDRLVKSAMLLGRGDETMLKIDRVGSSVTFEGGGAFCGAESGLICTTTSGARMRVEGMVVGGKGVKL